jgi:hypothetical protein
MRFLIESRQLARRIRQDCVVCRPQALHGGIWYVFQSIAAQLPQLRQSVSAHALDSQTVNDGRVVIGAKINADVVTILERVDVVEGIESVGTVGGRSLSPLPVDNVKDGPLLGFPMHRVDKIPAPEHFERVEQSRPDDQYEVSRCEGEAVDVGRWRIELSKDVPRGLLVGNAEYRVAPAAAELQRVVEKLAPLKVIL